MERPPSASGTPLPPLSHRQPGKNLITTRLRNLNPNLKLSIASGGIFSLWVAGRKSLLDPSHPFPRTAAADKSRRIIACEGGTRGMDSLFATFCHIFLIIISGPQEPLSFPTPNPKILRLCYSNLMLILQFGAKSRAKGRTKVVAENSTTPPKTNHRGPNDE